MAGSRKQEIDRNLGIMLEIIPDYPDYQFVIAAAPSIEPEYYSKYVEENDVRVVYNQTYHLYTDL